MTKHNFYQILRQIWPLTPTGRSQFLINIKNAFTSLIVESSCLVVPSFVHIVLAGSEWQAKTWFWGEIRSNFDLWPHQSKTNLWTIKNVVIGLFSWSSYVTMPTFVHIEFNGFEWQSKTWFLDSNDNPKRDFLGKFWPLTSNLTSLTLEIRSRSKLIFFWNRS